MTTANSYDHSSSTFHLKGAPGDIVAIRLSITSRMAASAVINPIIEPWIREDGEVLSLPTKLSPDYVYLQPCMEVSMTLAFRLPGSLEPGDFLLSSLRFPGIEEECMPMRLEITGIQKQSSLKIREHRICLSLPLLGYSHSGEDRDGQVSSKTIYTLLTGLASMDVIPVRWLVCELFVTISEWGAEFAKTKKGGQFLAKLSRTRFFKNGALAFRGAQLTHWIMVSLTISSGLNTVIGGKENNRMLAVWERWLFNLLDTDIEDFSKTNENLKLPYTPLLTVIKDWGTDSEKWFGYFILGLVKVSPRMAAILRKAADDVPIRRKKRNSTKRKKPSDVISEKGSLQR